MIFARIKGKYGSIRRFFKSSPDEIHISKKEIVIIIGNKVFKCGWSKIQKLIIFQRYTRIGFSDIRRIIIIQFSNKSIYIDVSHNRSEMENSETLEKIIKEQVGRRKIVYKKWKNKDIGELYDFVDQLPWLSFGLMIIDLRLVFVPIVCLVAIIFKHLYQGYLYGANKRKRM
ncbi:MAG: hypothetical protein A2044_08790 [Candidatus Firestonebacteria bacterium GWA2_43_8]|nr:MAG: hypothetical protein A2044_08790 [Candidatus Firestonebacteria bacterium GWA2_43_8]